MGRLGLIHQLCSVVAQMAELIEEMTVEIEQNEIASETKDKLLKKKKECDNKINEIGRATRRSGRNA